MGFFQLDKTDLRKLMLEKEIEIEKQYNESDDQINQFADIVMFQKSLINARQEESNIAQAHDSLLNFKNQSSFEMPAHIKMFLRWFLTQAELDFIKKTESGGSKKTEPDKLISGNHFTEVLSKQQPQRSTSTFNNPKLERLRINFEQSLKAPLWEIEQSNPTTSEIQPTLQLLKKSSKTIKKKSRAKSSSCQIINSPKWKQMQAQIEKLCDTQDHSEIMNKFKKMVNDLIHEENKEEMIQQVQQFFTTIFPETLNSKQVDNQLPLITNNSIFEGLQDIPKQSSSFKLFSKGDNKELIENNNDDKLIGSIPNYCQLINQCYDQNKINKTLKIFDESNLGQEIQLILYESSQKSDIKKVPLILIKNNEAI